MEKAIVKSQEGVSITQRLKERPRQYLYWKLITGDQRFALQLVGRGKASLEEWRQNGLREIEKEVMRHAEEYMEEAVGWCMGENKKMAVRLAHKVLSYGLAKEVGEWEKKIAPMIVKAMGIGIEEKRGEKREESGYDEMVLRKRRPVS